VASPAVLPAWSLSVAGEVPRLRSDWPATIDREWAWGGATGRGVRVCIVDSGVEAGHPLVGAMASASTVEDDGDELRVVPDEAGDVAGHGTACAGIVRLIAPDCELHSVRVLGPAARGGGSVLVAGLEWAIEQRFDVINLSLSTRKAHVADALRELADRAWFARVALVASAHNMAVPSFPWRFASVLSVGSHDGADPLEFHAHAEPPVEFFARGVDLEVAWPGGVTVRSTGNSYATPHLAAIAALILERHPGLTPYELKTILYLTASNVGRAG
jgi:subtilisin